MSDDEREKPEKVRFSKLQEVQLPALEKLERATSEMYWAIGYDAAEVPARTFGEIAGLARTHSVHVAEADYQVAGYAAWRDEAPGVGYVEELGVHPDYQQFGIGTSLFKKIEEEARGLGIKEIVLRCWERATWAQLFYRKLGFEKINEAAPAKVQKWLEDKSAGQPFLRPGELALWVAVKPEEKVEEEDEDEAEGEA